MALDMTLRKVYNVFGEVHNTLDMSGVALVSHRTWYSKMLQKNLMGVMT